MRHRGGSSRFDGLSVAQDGDSVRDPRQLFEPVRDVYQRDTLRFEFCDQAEQRIDFAVGQRGGRFVHHDQPRAARQALRDLGQLLLRDRQTPRRTIERQDDVQLGKHGRRLCGGGSAIEEHAAPRLDAEHDIFDHTQIRNQVELLIDHPDAEPLGRPWSVDDDGATVERNLAGIGRQRAGENLHEGRFSGAVLTDQRMHFARVDVERHAVERANAGEGLHDPRHPQERGGRRLQCGYLPASAFVYVPTATAILDGGFAPEKYA